MFAAGGTQDATTWREFLAGGDTQGKCQNNPVLKAAFRRAMFAAGGTQDATTWREFLAGGDTQACGERDERREVLQEAPS
jgi:hypothetical protein